MFAVLADATEVMKEVGEEIPNCEEEGGLADLGSTNCFDEEWMIFL